MVIVCSSTCEALVIFFFQAEDGIRDYKVTGVQTCALPICRAQDVVACDDLVEPLHKAQQPLARVEAQQCGRSEERRVGKSVDLGGRRIIKKKKNESRELSRLRGSTTKRLSGSCVASSVNTS